MIDFSKFGSIRDQLFTVGVLIVALFLMVTRQDDAFQNLRKASLVVVSTLEIPLSNVRVYRTALQTNAELDRQNILLQDEISRLRTLREENERLKELLALKDSTAYELVAVRVVSKKLTGINNSMIVNAGSNRGVRVGMPVLNADGLIGQVVLTSNRQAQILPLLNRHFRVSAMVEESRASGILSWEGTGPNELILRYIPQTVDVQPGMRVMTSGLSNQFPFGIPIGTVTGIDLETGKETQIIYVEPFASLYTLAEAHIMLYEPDEDVSNLQETWDRTIR
jgi:rod shape-determining protein MreC